MLLPLILFGLLALQPGSAARAGAAREAGRIDEAIALYREAVAARPRWAEGWWSLGTLLYDRDDYAGAAAALRRTVELNPQAGNAFVMLGLCEEKLGRNAEALRHIERGRSLDGGNDPRLRPVMLFIEGKLLLDAGKFGQAQETLGALAREGVDAPEAVEALGMAVLGMRSAPDAAAREVVLRAGRAEYAAARKESLDSAIREYERLAADFPKTRNVQFAAGRFFLANHLDDRAVQAFESEIANSPGHLLARLGIAGIKASGADPEAGLPYAREAVAMSPKLPEAHFLLGLLLLKTGDARAAVPELEFARAATPGDSRVWFQLSRAYAELNRGDDAARARAEFARLEKLANAPKGTSR